MDNVVESGETMSDKADKTGALSVLVEPTVQAATDLAASLFKTIVCEAVDLRGSCCIALAGGTTPHALYVSLAEFAVDAVIPWSKIDIFFGDERDVPLDHVESNYRMVQRTLLDNVPILPARVHPMRGDARDLAAAADEYENTIRNLVPAGEGNVPSFDLVLLGMGADGRTASLFPGTDALRETRRLVAENFVPILGRSRLTMTYPLINAARNVLMLVTGDDKGDVVAALVGEAPKTSGRLPAAGVTPANGRLVLILDAAAGRHAGLKPT